MTDLKKLAEEIFDNWNAHTDILGSGEIDYNDQCLLVSAITQALERVQKESLAARIEWPDAHEIEEEASCVYSTRSPKEWNDAWYVGFKSGCAWIHYKLVAR